MGIEASQGVWVLLVMATLLLTLKLAWVVTMLLSARVMETKMECAPSLRMVVSKALAAVAASPQFL